MSLAFVSVLGATGALQHPFGAEVRAPDIAAQQPWDTIGATGAVLQQAGRPAASTGASTSEANSPAADLVRFIIRTPGLKIPVGTLSGKL